MSVVNCVGNTGDNRSHLRQRVVEISDVIGNKDMKSDIHVCHVCSSRQTDCEGRGMQAVNLNGSS